MKNLRVKKMAWFVVRTLCAVALLGWTLSTVLRNNPAVSQAGLASIFSGMRMVPALAAIFCSFAGLFLGALRWLLLLRLQDISLGAGAVMRITCLGEFSNLAIPGALGCDAIRMLAVARDSSTRAAGVVSVLADRFIGLATIGAVAAVALLATFIRGAPAGLEFRVAAVAMLAMVAAMVVALVLYHTPMMRRFWRWLCERLPYGTHLQSVTDRVAYFGRSPQGMLQVLALSLMVQAAEIGTVVLLGHSLQLPHGWQHYCMCVPLINILSAVPVTPGALGLSEFLYVSFLGAAGNPERALALALLVRAIMILRTLPGATLAMIGGWNIRREGDPR